MITPEDASLTSVRRRLERERKARAEAEAIAERVTGELYSSAVALEQLNAELKGANLELQLLNQTMRDFVAVASHDLRGPLTSIIGSASLLGSKWEIMTAEQRTEFMSIIERQGQHLSRMVGDLLTASRIEAGQLDTRQEVIRLGEALRQIIDDFGGLAREIRLPTDGIDVLADPDHLERILFNYLGNAFKYGAPPVEIDLKADATWVEIRVRDHGAGVPEDFIPRLFGKFARGEGSVGGTGLGLSIVQGLARANGGDTWYEPNRPHGSCFAVRLPAAVNR